MPTGREVSRQVLLRRLLVKSGRWDPLHERLSLACGDSLVLTQAHRTATWFPCLSLLSLPPGSSIDVVLRYKVKHFHEILLRGEG